jgi:hypothetical protein
MDIGWTPAAGQTAQVTVSGAHARLAELVVGKAYRVSVTDVYPGKAEILLGNQYLLAATQLRFSPGDVIDLVLRERSPDLLVFQLILPSGEQADELNARLGTLLRAANLADVVENRQAMSMLISNGISVSNRSALEIAQLLSVLPQAVVAGFLPLYKELIERNIRLDWPVLLQMAKLSGEPSNVAEQLAGVLISMQAERARDKRKNRLLNAVDSALVSVDSEDELPTASVLKDKLALLYGSSEKQLLDFLHSLKPPDETAGRQTGIEPTPGKARLEFADLTNLAYGETVSAALADVLNVLQAQRVESSLRSGRFNLILPLLLDGEPTDVQVSIQTLAEQYYQKDYAIRLRLDNTIQGKTEIQIRTRGPGISVDILAEEGSTAQAYTEQLPGFRQELQRNTGLIPRHLAVSQTSV